MRRIFRCFIASLLLMFLFSCVSFLPPPSANKTGPRALILNDEIISEEDVGGFTSWYCLDFVYEERGVLLEFGYFNDPEYSSLGFVLYDGGYAGEFTLYQRKGLEHRWDWGPNYEYTFVIKPDGTGLYYDFSYAQKGESIKARDVFKCYKR